MKSSTSEAKNQAAPPVTTAALPLHEQADTLYRQGFRIMPLEDKATPLCNAGEYGREHPEATWGKASFGPGMGANLIGVLCGPCPALGEDWLLVCDFDGEWWNVPGLVAFYEALGATLSSHEDCHVFVRVPPSPERDRIRQWPDLLRTKKAVGAAVDLKWNGGYAAELFDWSSAADVTQLAASIQTIPAEALAMILDSPPAKAAAARPERRVAAAPETGDVPKGCDPTVVRDAAIVWLRGPQTTEDRRHPDDKFAPISIEGQCGSNSCYYVANELIGAWGLSEEVALDLMLEHYNPRCQPEWEEGQLEHKLLTAAPCHEYADRAYAAQAVHDWPAIEARWRAGTLFTPERLAWWEARGVRPATGAALAKTADTTIDEHLTTWKAFLQKTPKTLEPKASDFNTSWTLEKHPTLAGLFKYDEFTDRVVITRDGDYSWSAGDTFNADKHVAPLQRWFSHELGYNVATDTMIRLVNHEARRTPFHAVRQYLNGLPEWDGQDRNLAVYFGTEQTPYHRAVCAKWLRSAVTRAMRPGCKADTMLILEGPQGLLKSTSVAALCPEPSWFYEVSSKKVGDKDFMSAIRGHWIGEMAEVDKLISSRDASELKDLLSRTVDTYRPAYAHVDQAFPRQCVFIGTTNKSDYLRDETGNRRFWPVECTQLDAAGIRRDRDQIWAQALEECERGEIWWLTAQEEEAAATEQGLRLEEDPWENMLATFIVAETARAMTAGADYQGFAVTDALGGLPGAVPGAALELKDQHRMGRVLRALGCTKTRPRVEGRGGRRKLWKLPAPKPTEVGTPAAKGST